MNNRIDELATQAEKARNDFTKAVDDIRRTYAPSVAHQKIRALWREHQDAMQALRQQVKQIEEEERRRLRRMAFAVADDQLDQYRAALDRAEQAASQEQLITLVERADATGDKPLLKAAAFIAAQRGWSGGLEAVSQAGGASTVEAVAKLADFEERVGSTSYKFRRATALAAAPEPKEVRMPAPPDEVPA